MNKVIVERPRIGHSNKFRYFRHDKFFEWKEEDHYYRESMKKRYKYDYWEKSFNENLAPLWRWLAKQAGRKWNDVYSEIKKTFDGRKTINDHIMLHVKQQVYLDVYKGDNGKVYSVSGNNCWKSHELWNNDFYIDDDGILNQYKKEKYVRKEAPLTRFETKTHLFHKENGVWYYWTFYPQEFTENVSYQYNENGDVVSETTYITRKYSHLEYYLHNIKGKEYVALYKKQCNTKILKGFGLKNDQTLSSFL